MIHWISFKVFIKSYRKTAQKKCTAGSTTGLNLWPCVFNFSTSIWISTPLLTPVLQSLAVVLQFSSFYSGLTYTHYRFVFPLCTCTTAHTHTRKLISAISCEILEAPVYCFQSRATTLCEWKRESLCNIRPWDRKSLRGFARINGH